MESSIIEKLNTHNLSISLDEGEQLKVRQNSIATYTGAIETSVETAGGKADTVKRFVSGDTEYPYTLVVSSRSGGLTMAPQVQSEITSISLQDEEPIILQSLSFLAVTNGEINLYDESSIDKVAFLKITGIGQLYACGFGGITTFTLDEGKSTKVHTDYLLAYEDSVNREDITRSKTSGMLDFTDKLVGEESTNVSKITGPGRVYLHAQSPVRASSTTTELTDD